MKKHRPILFFLVPLIFLFSACSTELSNEGVFAGRIDSYNPTVVDSIQCSADGLTVGRSGITTDGSFSMILRTPVGYKIGKGPSPGTV